MTVKECLEDVWNSVTKRKAEIYNFYCISKQKQKRERHKNKTKQRDNIGTYVFP